VLDYLAIDFVRSLKIIRELANMARLKSAARERHQIRVVLKALRDIYFFEDRTFALLDRIKGGQEISVTDVERAAEGFAGSDDNVADAVKILEDFAHRNSVDVSIEVISNIRAILFGKGGARLAVLEFFMDFEDQLAHGKYEENERQNRVYAETLKNMLVELNDRIKEVDEYLIQLAKRG
jgi:hypothetical protein